MLRQGAEKHDVHAATGTTVGLAGIDLDIPAERITCIMGLSGSGKSTLVRHLNRLVDPTVGTILFDGVDILQFGLAELREWRRHRISMVFQSFGLLPHINVLDNVAFGLCAWRPKAQARKTARGWLERVGLREYETRYPDELSGGMRQRVGLARALAIDADVLLMDEAFSALDPLIRYDLQDQLLELQHRLKKTIVFVTHDIEEALRLGQHVVILRDGKVEQVGSPDDIRQRPANEYVERFITTPVVRAPHAWPHRTTWFALACLLVLYSVA